MYKFIDGDVCTPKGFKAGAVHSGIRKNSDKLDLCMIISDKICNASSVYTTNKIHSATITVTKEHLKDQKAQAIICNSGNANACNETAYENAKIMTKVCADIGSILEDDVIVASTGVIGVTLPIEKIVDSKENLKNSLNYNGGIDASNAILTTDLIEKKACVEFFIDDKKCTIGAIAKGSGMIHPNMATMLGFITTDVSIDSNALDYALKTATDKTFNMISVDGDTSTNDMVCILANGLSNNKTITQNTKEFELFSNALTDLCLTISKLIAKDGEGATKLIKCTVLNAKTYDCAKNIAKEVIASSLVKTAMFGKDANFGRILCAVGYANEEIDEKAIDIFFESLKGKICVCIDSNGLEFDEDLAKTILEEDEISILVDLKNGDEQATAYGCDLSYEYVRINGDYRS